MKVAVASMGTVPEALVGVRFGMCSQFLVFDVDTMEYVVVSVPPRHEDQDRVSLAAIRAVAMQGVSAVITGQLPLHRLVRWCYGLVRGPLSARLMRAWVSILRRRRRARKRTFAECSGLAWDVQPSYTWTTSRSATCLHGQADGRTEHLT